MTRGFSSELLMVIHLPLLLAAQVAGAAAAASPPPTLPLAVEVRAASCVVAGQHPLVEARVSRPDEVAEVRAVFRSAPPAREEEGDGWYRVRLSPDGDRWSGALPRPKPGLGSYVWYVEALDLAASVTRTEERVVRVAREPGSCRPDEAGPSAERAWVLVESPSDQAPPVPRGFSRKGAETAGRPRVGVFDLSARTSVIAGLGVGAATLGGFLAAQGDSEPRSLIELVQSVPPPGSTISLSALRVAVTVRVTSDVDLGPGLVFVGLSRYYGYYGVGCVTLQVPHGGIRAGQTLDVVVDQVASVDCAAPFSVGSALLEFRGPDGRPDISRVVPLSYSFEP